MNFDIIFNAINLNGEFMTYDASNGNKNFIDKFIREYRKDLKYYNFQ